MLADSIKVRGFIVSEAHNSNVAINDAPDATVEGISFFDTIANVFHFFGRDLNRWADIALKEYGLKDLN